MGQKKRKKEKRKKEKKLKNKALEILQDSSWKLGCALAVVCHVHVRGDSSGEKGPSRLMTALDLPRSRVIKPSSISTSLLFSSFIFRFSPVRLNHSSSAFVAGSEFRIEDRG